MKERPYYLITDNTWFALVTRPPVDGVVGDKLRSINSARRMNTLTAPVARHQALRLSGGVTRLRAETLRADRDDGRLLNMENLLLYYTYLNY